jgi:hypothetical protein
MTWDFVLGVAIGALSMGAFAAGRGYERLRLIMAERSAAKPVQAVPDPAPVAT